MQFYHPGKKCGNFCLVCKNNKSADDEGIPSMTVHPFSHRRVDRGKWSTWSIVAPLVANKGRSIECRCKNGIVYLMKMKIPFGTVSSFFYSRTQIGVGSVQRASCCQMH